MSRKLQDLLPRMVVDLPGCPEELIYLELRAAWRRFARHSGAVRERRFYPTVAQQRRYPIASQYGAEILYVSGVWVRSAEDVAQDRDGNQLTGLGYSKTRTLGGQDVLQLAYAPSESVQGGLVVEMALLPVVKPDADELGELGNAFEDDVVAGALAQLAGQGGKKWSSKAVYQQRMAEYLAGVSRAKTAAAERNRGGRPASLGGRQ